MKREGWIIATIALVLGVSLAVADKLSDFKTAAGKKGCASIPYSDLQDDCDDEGGHVHEYCDGKRGPVTCGSESITRDLKSALAKAKDKLEDLKDKKDDLKNKKSRASDRAEQDRIQKEIDQVERDISDADKAIRKANDDLDDRKDHVNDAISTIEKCINYRRAVMNIFARALDKVRGESDDDIKPFARTLRDKYQAEKRGHEIAISDKEKALDTCKKSRP